MSSAMKGHFPWAGLLALALAVPAPALRAQDEKVRVAVVNFDTHLVEEDGWQFPWSASSLSPLATSMLTNELASHQRFTVIERRYIEDLLKEQNLGGGGRVNPDAAAQIGQLLGAQVVIVGDVEEFGTKKTGGVGGVARGLIGASQEKMQVVLAARLIDAATGEILATSEGQADVSQGAFALLTRSVGGIVGTELEGEASTVMRKAVDDLAANIAAESQDLEFKPMVACLVGTVATVAGGRVYLALGASTSIAPGDYFQIRDRQAPILDPATGDTLGFVESELGYVQISEVQERMSIADVLDGGGFASGQAAVRSGPPDDDTPCVNVAGAGSGP